MSSGFDLLTSEHATFLEGAAITPEVCEDHLVFSVLAPGDLEEYGLGWAPAPGIAFTWCTPSGLEVLQYRPDKPVADSKGRISKYLQQPGMGSVIWELRRDDASDAVLFVEGTKQALAAAAWSKGISVYGVAGCRNWVRDGLPSSDLEVVADKRVVVAFDADIETNRDVWDAAEQFTRALKAEGASEIRYLLIPSGGKAGLDDVLGSRDPARRASYLASLMAMAEKKLPAKPPAKPKSPFFDNRGGLLTDKLSDAILEQYPAALTVENRVAIYTGGVYRTSGTAFVSAAARLLGDDYRKAHRVSAEEYVIGLLADEQRYLPAHLDAPVLNLTNGMLDLLTGELTEHDSSWRSQVQFPIAWDPDAVAPVYEAWLEDVIPDQAADLEETASQLLDPSRTPPKAIFLFGPSRSGKSTFLRLMAAVAGAENTSAVTLHQLVQDRFAAANVFGKALNSAADMSAAHVEDLSIFKMLTGEDLIHADRKFGGQFTFVNRALFAFSANELPTVAEHSSAYIQRIKPFRFDRSFAGHEDPAIEMAMITELPGILVRWVAALARLRARGRSLPTLRDVANEFAVKSDRVRQWVTEQMQMVKDGTDGLPRRRLAELFNEWAIRNGGHKMQERKVIERLLGIPGIWEIRLPENRSRGLNLLVRGENDPDPGSYGQFGQLQGLIVRKGEASHGLPLEKFSPDKKVGDVNGLRKAQLGVETAQSAQSAQEWKSASGAVFRGSKSSSSTK